MEEALICWKRGGRSTRGGVGGATLDIVARLNEADAAWLPPAANAPLPDPRWSVAIDLLKQQASDPQWKGMNNGLSELENRSSRPHIVPATWPRLVSMGLGRLAAAGTIAKCHHGFKHAGEL